MQLIRKRVAVFLALCTTLLVAACASDPKPEPPTSLKSITPVVETARQWSKKTDYVGRGRFEPYVDADQVVVATRDGAVSSFDPLTAAVNGVWMSKAHWVAVSAVMHPKCMSVPQTV